MTFLLRFNGEREQRNSSSRLVVLVSLLLLLALSSSSSSVRAADAKDGDVGESDNTTIDYGNHNRNWEDGPTSWSEFGHDNSPDVCGLPLISVEEWESGRYWERDTPVMVANVPAHWDALHNWKLSEMLYRYPNAEATTVHYTHPKLPTKRKV